MSNIAQVLAEAAERFGGRIAFGSLDSGISYDRLLGDATAIAARLRSLGSPKAVLAGPNSSLVPAVIFGAAMAGSTYVPLNHRLPEAARARLFARLEPAVLVTADWLDDPAPRPTDDTLADGTDPAAIVFTSGSSAEPKAVLLDHHHLMSAALREPAFSAGRQDAALLTAPPFHLPNLLILLASFHTGRRVVPYSAVPFSAREWLDTVRREHVTQAVLVPTMLQRIVEHLDQTGEPAPVLTRLGYGSARMPQPVLARALELFPTASITNGYGSTEATGAVSLLSGDDHRTAWASSDPEVRRRLGSAGRPFAGVELKIVDAAGEEVPAGERGQILVRGPQVSGRYLDAPDALTADGWLRTGDEGWIDPAGYLYCEGRGDDILVIGGENVAVAEIEDTLMRNSGVREAAVVGVENDEWGEIPVALVASTGAPLDVDALAAWTRHEIGGLKTPRYFFVVDDLPQTATGKLLRREVRRQALVHLTTGSPSVTT